MAAAGAGKPAGAHSEAESIRERVVPVCGTRGGFVERTPVVTAFESAQARFVPRAVSGHYGRGLRTGERAGVLVPNAGYSRGHIRCAGGRVRIKRALCLEQNCAREEKDDSGPEEGDERNTRAG